MKDIRILQVLFTLVSVCLLAGCEKANLEDLVQPVRSSVVETRQPELPVRFSASVLPSKQVDLAFRVGGYVESTYRLRNANGTWRDLEPGDMVPEGTVLAKVRATDYQSRSDVLMDQVSEARAAHASAQSQMSEEIAARDLANTEYTRAKILFVNDAMTKSDFDQVNLVHDRSEARVDAARSQVAYQQAKIDGAVAARRETASALSDTFLRAPFSGVVLSRKIDLGSLVAPNSLGFVFADLHSVKLAFDIPDLDLKIVKLGQFVPITVDAIPGTPFIGRVISISPSADPVDRGYTVELAVPNQNNALKAYMIATIQLTSAVQDSPASLVPLSAIVHTNPKDGYSVYVIAPKNGVITAQLRAVNLGQMYGDRVAVTQGLRPGEHVVEDGALQLVNGAHVRELQGRE